jgi:hypothetical protein
MKQGKLYARCTLAMAAAAIVGQAHAGAVPDPGDYTALPAGTNLSLLYLQNARADDVYASGNRVALPRDLDLNLQVGLLRQIYFTKLGGYTIDPQIVIPFARQNDALGGGKLTGVGDVLFGGTLWTIADLAGGEHLGYSLFLTAPTGGKNDRGFAISDNRWAADLHVGYIRRIAPKWTVDLIGQTEFFQDRRDTGSEKDPMVRLYGHLRYHLNDASHLAASLRYTGGAREKLGVSELSGRKKDVNLALTWASFLTKQVQMQAQYSRDVRVENGPRLDTLTVRALYAY